MFSKIVTRGEFIICGKNIYPWANLDVKSGIWWIWRGTQLFRVLGESFPIASIMLQVATQIALRLLVTLCGTRLTQLPLSCSIWARNCTLLLPSTLSDCDIPYDWLLFSLNIILRWLFVHSFHDSKFVVFFVGFILFKYVNTHIMIMLIGRVMTDSLVQGVG
jgi:hypothetical protein